MCIRDRYRIYVEKKAEFANEAKSLKNEVNNLLQIDRLTNVRVLNRYDVENIDKNLFDYAVNTVFSEPQVDVAMKQVTFDDCDFVFAVEYLPGQFDQRANSAAECIQIISKGERPTVKTAKVYMLSGALTKEDLEEIKKYVINPVEAREADLLEYKTLKVEYEIPTKVDTLDGFCSLDKNGLIEFIDK